MALKIRYITDKGEAKVFEIGRSGLMVGRASTNDISIPDEKLSRRHCMFELRDSEKLFVVDLKSANGTFVNGKTAGEQGISLTAGDVVTCGDQSFEILDPARPKAGGKSGSVDLGFHGNGGHGDAASGAEGEQSTAGQSGERERRKKMWVWISVWVAVLLAAMVILNFPAAPQKEPVRTSVDSSESNGMASVEFEKVDADTSGIFRYAMYYDGFTGELSVTCDDIPVNKRQIRKKTVLSEKARARLLGIFDSESAFMTLDEEYSGMDPAQINKLSSRMIRIVRGRKVKCVQVVNTMEPAVFLKLREALEAFSRNELGVWAIQYSREKLIELALRSRELGNSKYEEREVDYGNLAASVAAYSEAVFYLETVNPKPDWFDSLVTARDAAVIALDKVYKDQRFLADKALNMRDWTAARGHLNVLIRIIPDKNDERNREAKAKLVDVEKRLQKGDGR